MAALLKLLRRLRRSESGAEFVEMALSFPLLMLVVLGIIDFGLLFQRYEVMTNAAREGARVAALPDYCPDPDTCVANVEARVDEYIQSSLLGPAGHGTCVGAACDGVPTMVSIGGNCMSTMQVTVLYPHPFDYLGGIMSYFSSSLGSRTLTATSTMRQEVAAGTC